MIEEGCSGAEGRAIPKTKDIKNQVTFWKLHVVRSVWSACVCSLTGRRWLTLGRLTGKMGKGFVDHVKNCVPEARRVLALPLKSHHISWSLVGTMWVEKEFGEETILVLRRLMIWNSQGQQLIVKEPTDDSFLPGISFLCPLENVCLSFLDAPQKSCAVGGHSWWL